MKTIAFERVEGVVLMVESGRAIADTEWDEYLAEISRTAVGTEVRVVVAGSASPPSADQRLRLKRTLAGRALRTAVISDSVITRTAVAAFSLFVPDVRGFRSDAVDAALEHVLVPRGSRQTVERALARLRQSLQIGATQGPSPSHR